MNRNGHHSHKTLAGDAGFAVVGVVPAGLGAVVEPSVVADVELPAVVVDAAALVVSFVAADSDSGVVVRPVDPTYDPAQVGHDQLYYSSCCCCYFQTMLQSCYYVQLG